MAVMRVIQRVRKSATSSEVPMQTYSLIRKDCIRSRSDEGSRRKHSAATSKEKPPAGTLPRNESGEGVDHLLVQSGSCVYAIHAHRPEQLMGKGIACFVVRNPAFGN